MTKNITRSRNPRTGTVHIVRHHHKRYGDTLYCGREGKYDSLSAFDSQPMCKSCIKVFIATVKKSAYIVRKQLIELIEANTPSKQLSEPKNTESDNTHTRYVLATNGGYDQRYRAIVDEADMFGNILEFGYLEDAVKHRDEMPDSEDIMIVKEIREMLDA